MILDLIATCNGGTCPSIYAVPDGPDVVVQGYVFTDAAADLVVPTGEQLVRIPRSVLLDAAARLADVL